jgi:radical SAM family uncharacterized protein
MHAFFDAFFIGEADSAIREIVEAVRAEKKRGATRARILEVLAQIPSMYVPAVHDKAWAQCGDANKAGQARTVRRVETDFARLEPPTNHIVAYTEVVHDRIPIEIMRGCTRGCRFCQAGMAYRPVRERSADMVVRAALRGVRETGMEEISLTSLASTDHSQIAQIVRRLNAQLSDRAVSISIPSIRVDALSIDLIDALSAGAKKPGLTLAPEAGTQRMRDIINKNVTDEQLFEAIEHAFSVGYRRVKLYFMIGLPHETDEDIVGIAELVKKVHRLARETIEPAQRGAVKISVSVNAFVPKAHTPFQWAAQDSLPEIQRKQELLRSVMPRKGVVLSLNDARMSLIEGVLARADRTLSAAVEAAWRRGARFEAYAECFDATLWDDAFAECGIDAQTHRAQRSLDDTLPWAYISMGASTRFLSEEAKRAAGAETIVDCSRDACSACNACEALEAYRDIREERT